MFRDSFLSAFMVAALGLAALGGSSQALASTNDDVADNDAALVVPQCLRVGSYGPGWFLYPGSPGSGVPSTYYCSDDFAYLAPAFSPSAGINVPAGYSCLASVAVSVTSHLGSYCDRLFGGPQGAIVNCPC